MRQEHGRLLDSPTHADYRDVPLPQDCELCRKHKCSCLQNVALIALLVLHSHAGVHLRMRRTGPRHRPVQTLFAYLPAIGRIRFRVEKVRIATELTYIAVLLSGLQ